MRICIFENNNTSDFEPFCYYRPVFDMVCGISTLKEKILRLFPEYKYSVICRDFLVKILTQRNPGLPVNNLSDEDYLFINGSLLAGRDLRKQIQTEGKEDLLYMQEDIIVAARLSSEKVKKLSPGSLFANELLKLNNIKKEKIDAVILQYSFDFLKYHPSEMLNDNEYFTGKNSFSEFADVHYIEKEKIYIGEGTKIKPGVVIDASGGPVIIGKNCLIMPNSVIEGAVFIGDNTIIRSCSTIYSNVSIGKVCKLGGEVEESIILDYSNKQHSGFLGHSYLGSWVNLGADTNCSDLKNNYSNVKITINNKEVDTGMQFLGLLIGDHSKTAINTMFNTGTVAGFSSNIFGAGFPPKYIPSFAWGGSEGITGYLVEKSIETAKKVFGRRNVSFTEAEEKLFKRIYELTNTNRSTDSVLK